MNAPDRDSRRLTDPEYWDAQYEQPHGPPPSSSHDSSLKRLVKRLLGPRFADWTRDYRDYLLWEQIYARYMRVQPGAKVLEVGSAPGTHLVELHKAFGFEPFGVEYTEHGVQRNREEFQKHGINPDNVIHADFLSTAFQRSHAEAFDVVISRGFIEHFTDVKAVVNAHVKVLARNGLLVVTIPNLRGLNYVLQRFFDRERLPLHNLSIMQRSVFRDLFEDEGLSALQCSYYGTFSFGVIGTRPTFLLRTGALSVLRRSQTLLNLLFRLLFGPQGAETAFSSPYLIYIGRKTE